MKKYLITGCAGFIGSNFVYYMLKKYEDILLVNLDKLTYAGNLENLKGVEGALGLPANIVCYSRAMTKIITISTIRGRMLEPVTQKAL